MIKYSRYRGVFRPISALAWGYWGVLHLWVAFEGLNQYITSGTPGLWRMVIGGTRVPQEIFEHSTNPVTTFAQGQLLLNFCLDVGGYGVLALIIAWLVLNKGSWIAYFIGLFVIGIADLAFSFSLVTSGVTQENFATISGPIVWLVACVVTPFSLPRGGGAS